MANRQQRNREKKEACCLLKKKGGFLIGIFFFFLHHFESMSGCTVTNHQDIRNDALETCHPFEVFMLEHHRSAAKT